MVSKQLGEHLPTNCVQKNFIDAFKYQKHTKFVQNFVCLSKNDHF